jgi:PAS domain S-box-containing protein
LRSGLEDFESTFNQVAVGMAQVSLDGVFIRVNKKLAKMLGYDRSEIEGQGFNSLTHKSDHKIGLDMLLAMKANQEQAVSFEKRYIKKNGEIIWVRVTTAVVADNKQLPQHFISVLEDVTETINRERENSDQKIRMVAASKINGVGRMAAGMAHEINNPLTIVMGQASRLKKMATDSKLNPNTVFTMADQIESMASRIADIISGLRSFAREGSDEPILSTSLQQILNDSLKFCRAKILLSQINLKVDEGTKNVYINCRGVHLTQALLNVINNAKDAVEGKKNQIIEIKIFSDNKYSGFEVHDNGDGVREESIPLLFQPFFSTKPVGLGTGLGLSITKDLVEKYNGEISYQRSPLGGACFKITFKS